MISVICRLGLAIAISGMWAMAAHAVLTPADSSTFAHKYEASALPQNEDPIYSQLGGYVPSVGGGILTYNTVPGGPGGGIWWTAASTWGSEHVSGGAFTIEIRARILEAVGDVSQLQVWVGGPAGDGSTAFIVGTDAVAYYGPGNLPLADSLDNMTEFHNYRIAREADSPDYHFFRDGVEVGVVQAGEFTFGPDLYFGDGGSGGGGHVEIDYYRWTTAGAFSPVLPNVPGDFDSDGDVDGADFVAWQTHFPTANGATLAEGDADADGDVDGADFVVWQTNFPFTPGSAISSVPEPQPLLMGSLGALIVATRLRRK